MLVSLASLAVLVSAASVDNPAYDAQLDTIVGSDYRAAVNLLGLPESRDLREGGGEVWTFRYRRGGENGGITGPNTEVDFESRQQSVNEADGGYVTPPPSALSGPAASGGSSGSGNAQPAGSTETGIGRSATRRQSERICTTRIALNPDGTIDGYTYVGQCYPR
tara:strand:- start:2387 stop:2878 length:492 start_codon:yes stop_codon:yes gene_type:complete